MWKHYCVMEKAWVSVGNGEPCNWCGLRGLAVLREIVNCGAR